MLATAEQNYRDLRLQNKSPDLTLTPKETEIVLDVAVLRYLKRNNRLPGNVTEAFANGTTLDRKKELAMFWING